MYGQPGTDSVPGCFFAVLTGYVFGNAIGRVR